MACHRHSAAPPRAHRRCLHRRHHRCRGAMCTHCLHTSRSRSPRRHHTADHRRRVGLHNAGPHRRHRPPLALAATHRQWATLGGLAIAPGGRRRWPRHSRFRKKARDPKQSIGAWWRPRGGEKTALAYQELLTWRPSATTMRCTCDLGDRSAGFLFDPHPVGFFAGRWVLKSAAGACSSDGAAWPSHGTTEPPRGIAPPRRPSPRRAPSAGPWDTTAFPTFAASILRKYVVAWDSHWPGGADYSRFPPIITVGPSRCAVRVDRALPRPKDKEINR
jgi:hypothetical protein